MLEEPVHRIAYMIPESAVIELLKGCARVVDFPEGAEVVYVTHDWNTRCFIYVLHHPSFPIVYPGYEYVRQFAELERIETDEPSRKNPNDEPQAQD